MYVHNSRLQNIAPEKCFIISSNYLIFTSRVRIDKTKEVIQSPFFASWELTLAISFNFVKNVQFERKTIAGSVITSFSLSVIVSVCADQKFVLT